MEGQHPKHGGAGHIQPGSGVLVRSQEGCVSLVAFCNFGLYRTAPFNTTKDRNEEQVNSNPGPGTYANQERKVVPKVQDKMNNAFTTKVSKLWQVAAY